MYVYYLPIALAFLAIPTNVLHERRVDIALLFVIILTVSLISGLRYFSDVDYEPYFSLYMSTPGLGDITRDDLRILYGEPGYLFFSSLLRSLDAKFFVLTLSAALVSIGAKCFVASRLLTNASFAIAVYLCLSFITIELIQVRWAIATGILSVAFYLLYVERKKAAYIAFLVATGFHYYSIFFFILSFALKVKGSRRYIILVLSALVFSVAVKLSGATFLYEVNTGIYLVTRFLRYLNDPQSSIGLFSYLKIVFYVLSVLMLTRLEDCRIDIESDSKFNFLFRSTFILLSAALFVSFVPFFFFRAMVLADLFAVMLIAYMISHLDFMPLKIAYAYSLAFLFSLWCFFDVSNYQQAQRLYEYENWLRFTL